MHEGTRTINNISRYTRVMARCHIELVEKECGSEAAMYADKHWRYDSTYCFIMMSTQPATITHQSTDIPSQHKNNNDRGVNATGSVRQTINALGIFLMCLLHMHNE